MIIEIMSRERMLEYSHSKHTDDDAEKITRLRPKLNTKKEVMRCLI